MLDIEGIAPCLPGAELQEVEGDEYRGVVKVKVGPITAQYKGTAKLAEVDEASRRIVIDASGRDTRGQGNAKATIVVTMASKSAGTQGRRRAPICRSPARSRSSAGACSPTCRRS